MSWWMRTRSVVNWVTGITVGAQVATMVGLSVAESIRRRHRKPHRFPTTPPHAVEAEDDEITVYTYGEDVYADMLAAIDQAEHTIYFETFIWKGDEVGQKFKDGLIRASRRGVDVYVVYDRFANLVVKPSFYRLPPEIHLGRHPLIGGLVPRPRNGGRDHRKLLVVDSAIAFIGGYNIGSLYADRWRDTHARVVGPSVAEIENAFVDYWNSGPAGMFGIHRRTPELESPRERVWEGPVQIHRNSPSMAVYPIRNMYLEAIDRANERVWLTHAYLIPDDDLVAALHAACQRGADVRIIVPAQSNHVVADWLSRGFYDDLLTKGIRLFLYQGAMVHAKTAVIDSVWSTIGTANLDRMSMLGNYEVNAEIVSPEVAAQLEEVYRVDLTNCVELTKDEWRRRSVTAKFTEYLLSPWRPLF
ncbi:phospholipase D-like domain-containing protein [Aestuariimicrobium sp. T2.26MG-19.2B]|uniref:phospholipase D-like domain-containing protein n=1 Tax=Aestuariimicrobium sp. T2.26MG-19.2B TaxID=3040679 RepID=UPI002541E739|nr:phospholipase D-like domain-containing protein [Aestuariimicrobium sp. T2.26MG-19.2B]